MNIDAKQFLEQLFRHAVYQALPSVCMPPFIKQLDASNGLCVISIGKGSVEMARVINERFGKQCYGLIVTRHGYTNETAIGNIRILQASHPIPDLSSQQAAQSVLELAQQTPNNVPVIFLISGGGSALVSQPITGLDFNEKIEITKFLLASGASISDINLVRKQLSAIKGGKLAKAVKGPHRTFVISDVVGDSPQIIASGLTVSDNSTPEQALEVLRRYKWPALDRLSDIVLSQTRHQQCQHHMVDIIATNKLSIDSAVAQAKQQGFAARVLSYSQEGIAHEVAVQDANIAKLALTNGEKVILFYGGELTVALADTAGNGGPNQEYLLALAIALNGLDGIAAISCDTDGIDGNVDVAGAYIDATTLTRAQAIGLDPQQYLRDHNSFEFFHRLNDSIVTGATHTNVNDFRAIMITPANTG